MLEHLVSSAVLRRTLLLIPAAAAAVVLSACATGGVTAGDGDGIRDVVLASTTSTEDSGLFGVLIPAFEDAHPQYRVNVIAVGTGQALEIGRNGDADVLLVHAEPLEQRFVADGYGTGRRDVMYNEYVIVGPASDPAEIAGFDNAAAAFTAISDRGAAFVSRGDDSGTHAKELEVWESIGIEPSGDWYLSIGQGMGEALVMASELEAYTLVDRGTYLAMRDRIDLAVVVEGDPVLFNQYGVIVVAAADDAQGAKAFSDWVCSPEAQGLIREFGIDTYGEPLFVPNAEREGR